MTMRAGAAYALAMALLLPMSGVAHAQFTVLDEAQPEASAAPGSPCGSQPITIASMTWPSAALLAEIHAQVLAREFGCVTRIIPGDLAATAASMGSTGQPALAPEMWVTRTAEAWNLAIEAQLVRPAAPSYGGDGSLEGWFVPDFVASQYPDLVGAADLAQVLPLLAPDRRVRFVSCPPDWACAVINRNLLAAYGLTERVELIEPANRFEMDTLIGEAVSRQEPIVFYYWQPNAILAQFGFVPLDMGPYDETAAKCLASLVCAEPVPSAFVPETVVSAVAEWVFTDAPAVAGYLQRSAMPLAVMNELLAQLNGPGATPAGVATRFVTEQENVWRGWVGSSAP